MRVVVADDSVLLREGIVAPARGGRLRGRRARRATPRTCCARSAPTGPTSRSSTSGCRPTHTDEGLRAARGDPRSATPRPAVLVLSQYVEEAYALELLPAATEGIGYLLKDRVADVDALHRRGAPRGRGRLARSTPRSSSLLLGPPPPRRPARRADRRASARCSG